MANPELEYNLAGGLMMTTREGDFKYLCNEVAESGYRHGCVLPFRALNTEHGVEKLKNAPLTIVHIEEAWNPTHAEGLSEAIVRGLLGSLKRMAGDKNEPPILQDALFPDALSCRRLFNDLVHAFPEAKYISHRIDLSFPSERLLVEINQGLNLSSSELLEKSEEMGFGLVFDPRHLLRPSSVISAPGCPTVEEKGEWERQFNAFLGKIEVVDINGVKDDVDDLLEGRGMLKELSVAAREGKVRFLRVEIPIPVYAQIPHSPFQEKGFAFLAGIGQVIGVK